MGLIVQKFGGTSLASAEKIHRAARRAIRAKLKGKSVVLVVSAMGHTTDKLIKLSREISDNPPKRELDMLLTTGEQVSIALMAMAIHSVGHGAISLTGAQLGLMTDRTHTRARIQSISRDRIDQELARGNIVIVAGFQGIDAGGEITTLGRGASDTTAAALAAVLKAEICEIYTDVDGVYTADPRIVPQARKIDRIAYDTMLEMAASGAGVMHSRAIEFGKKFNVPIHVRSSLTDTPGTLIMTETEGMEAVAVRGVTLKQNIGTIALVGVPNAAGAAAKIFGRIADENVFVDDIVQSMHADGSRATIAFSADVADLSEAHRVCEELAQQMDIEKVVVNHDACKVSAIGIGMRSHTGIAGAMFKALADGGVNIQYIFTSEIVIGCIVHKDDGQKAVRLVHDAFGLGKE